MYPTKRRGRPPKEEPKFPDVTQMSDLTEARQPLNPPKAEMFAQAIVRLNGDVRRACAEVMDPLSDPSYSDFDKLPASIQKRVKYLLNRAASETVADRREVELLIKKIYRDKSGVFKVEDRREIAKELGDVLWYVTRLGATLGFSIEEIAQMNINKLEDRAKRDAIKGEGDNR